MRTTLDIPEPLLEEARHLLGVESNSETVVLALQDLVRRQRIDELKSLLGSVNLDLVDRGDHVVLRSPESLPSTTLEEIVGCMRYRGPAKTLEEMEAGIAEGARSSGPADRFVTFDRPLAKAAPVENQTPPVMLL